MSKEHHLMERIRSASPEQGKTLQRHLLSEGLAPSTLRRRYGSTEEALKRAGVYTPWETIFQIWREDLSDCYGYYQHSEIVEMLSVNQGFFEKQSGEFEEWSQDLDDFYIRRGSKGAGVTYFIKGKSYDEVMEERFQNIPDKYREKAVELLGKGHKPSVIRASVKYIESDDLSQVDVCEEFGVSELSLRKNYQLLDEVNQ